MTDLPDLLFAAADDTDLPGPVRAIARQAALELRAHQDIARELRSEAEIAARTGQGDRLNALADRLERETGP